MTDHPEWFIRGDRLLGGILEELGLAVRATSDGDLNLGSACDAAGLHFVQCLQLSGDFNRKGLHAIAISLVRQCLEAHSVVEAGFQASDLRRDLLNRWLDGKITGGGIRKRLDREVWASYGNGLWDEPWSEFMSEFTQAVHPYAHYSQLLQGWQFAHLHDDVILQSDGSYHAYMAVGANTYDATKATRITLLHMILAWIAGRTLLAHGHAERLSDEVHAAGRAIAEAEWLGGGKASWHQEFWPHMFDMPKA